MTSQGHLPDFPLPNKEAPVSWHFDRGLEALVLVERTTMNGKPHMNIGAWSRHVWQATKFSLDELRLMPGAPPVVHEALLRDSRWK